MKNVFVASAAALMMLAAVPVSADGGMMITTSSPVPVVQTTIQPAVISNYNERVSKIVTSVLELFDWKNDNGEITFTDTSYSVQYDCNTIFGGYSVDLMDVDFGESAMTKMACSDETMDADQKLVEDLQNITTLTFVDGKLVMTGVDTTLSFTAVLPDTE
jgi:heat shock protein HslJ